MTGFRLKEEQTLSVSKLGLNWTRSDWDWQGWRLHDHLQYWGTKTVGLARIALLRLNFLEHLVYTRNKTQGRNKPSCSCCVVGMEGIHRKAQRLSGSIHLVIVTQSCPTLCDPTDCSLPGSSVHGILQARILEWIAIPFSRRTSQPRDWTLVSCLTGRFFTIWATGKLP